MHNPVFLYLRDNGELSLRLRDKASGGLMLGNRQLWAVSTASCIRSVGFGASWPFMAIFFNINLKISIFYVGVIFTILSVFSSIFSLLGGHLSDRIGRRNTLLAGSVIGLSIYATLSILVFTHANEFIIIGFFISSSISGAFVFPAASALVSDVTSESERNTAYSLYRIMSNVGWAIGPLTGGFLSAINIGYIFTLVAITSLIQLTVVALFLHPVGLSAPKRGSAVRIGLDWKLILFAAGTFFITLVSSQFSVTLPVYSTKVVGILESNIGYIYAVNGLVVVLGQYPMSWITRKISIVHVMAIGSAFYSFGYFLVAFSHSLYGLMFDMLFITVGENLTSPGMNTVVSQIAPEGKTGRYMGFLSMANSAGRAIGPSIGSFFMFFYVYNGLKIWSTIGSLGFVSIALLLIFNFTVYRKRSDPTEVIS